MRIEFTNLIPFVQACAEFARQGIAFEAFEHTNGEFYIRLTGGY